VTEIRRLAVVNRGEAAMRALAAVAELNQEGDPLSGSGCITTIAVHTDADADSWFVRQADEAVCLGSSTYLDPADGRRKSRYLDDSGVLAALRDADADAVWVGWGFAAERASFAQHCEDAGILFVGPDSAAIRLVCDQVAVRRLAEKAGVPVVPWSDGPVDDVERALLEADRLGYPVLIKAAAGSGAWGTGLVVGPEDLPAAFASARSQADRSFGDPTVFLEAVIPAARQVDVQLVADGHGTVWALGTRDCSLQRNDHKLIEESTSTALDPAAETEIRSAAVQLALAAGYHNVGTVGFLVDPVTGAFFFLDVKARLQVGHGVTEATTGVDLVKLQLHVARGGRLEGSPPQERGHAVAARLCTEDPDDGFALARGVLARLRLATGVGVRVDSGVREGDDVPADFHPLVAIVIAWGADRGEAHSRLRRALAQSAVVVDRGTANRAFLLSLLDQPDVRAGRFDTGWLDRFVAADGHVPPQHPVALLVAAVEAYDADHAAVQAAFHVGARRGRPERPAAAGTRVRLRYREVGYELDVYRTSPGTYRVTCAGSVADLGVRWLGQYSRRVVCGDRSHRVQAVTQDAGFRVEVDDTAHQVAREEGSVVRAASPAFVVSLLVAPGDEVVEGSPVAVLESMKMETTVLAPLAGTVASVHVVANAQVDAGAPLVRIRDAGMPTHEATTGTPVDLSGLTARPAAGRPPCERVFGALDNYLLGYDLDDASLKRLFVEQRRLGEIAPLDDAALLSCEDSLLDLFADVGGLYRPRTETDDELGSGSAQEFLLAFLQWLDVDRAGLPDSFAAALEVALARYGVRGLDRTPELDAAVVWMFRSFTRVVALVPVVVSILMRRLRAGALLAPLAGADMRTRLDRLVTSSHGRHPAVAELARDVRFHYFEEPVLQSLVAASYRESEQALDDLAADLDRPQRAADLHSLVDSPQPQRGPLLRRWVTATDPRFQQALLEVYARRYYRTRDLQDLRFVSQGDHLLCLADYDWANKHILLVMGYADYGDLSGILSAIETVVRSEQTQRAVVIDIATWRVADQQDADVQAAELSELLSGTHFDTPPWRLDLTVTNTGGQAAEHFRTQHMTFRPAPDGGFAEELIYRNLHPMLAKRMDQWRLANFRLERLPSAEDVYLFHGVAHENPSDHRLFAMAEVRDLTVVPGPDGAPTYPWLERTGLMALAAIRQALTEYAPRERPKANRAVLFIRPPWRIAPESWPTVAESFSRLSEGAGLERVVLRVSIPQPDGGLRESALHVEGIGGGGLTITEHPPGDEPVRPMTRYRQKVLVAERFGVPYPYEIVRMLAPAPGTSADFPPGEFTEYDVGPDGDLVPVDREAGENDANVVVGLLTSYTDKVPEGMTRVALLSDPTKGLGNLAEPECRRVLAALDLAERLSVPVEWFAVSSGALIAMDSGTENMDWIADVLRRLIEFTQDGGEVNIIVTGINVGGQPYWNAEATMLLHTKGILVMTPDSAMVLTGKQALDFSGGMSAEDNFGIGGFDRVMGPNGQAQYWAPTFEEACQILLRHYDHSYVVPGERFPRRTKTADPYERDVRDSPHRALPGSDFRVVGDVFAEASNPERKSPFDIRSVMRAVSDTDADPLERWARWRDAENSVVWDTHVGGIPVCMLGLESRALPRRGFVPADGPPAWTSGTLFPQASRKTARAVNAASGNRPLVVLANLSGFDGSPESMRKWQLEYGAEIGRSITNFAGPIVFVVVSRYHGGAFVVFSKKLNPSMEIVAVEGSYASVIGGAPAAATVFARDVKARTAADPRVTTLNSRIVSASGSEASTLRAQLVQLLEQVRSEKLGEVADEFDAVHTIERALSVGSVDRIIPAAQLRPYVVDALERGMARTLRASPG
jgi:acetyl/propionyl-CoA carboxylase alpha subunit/acetyl-CoA carboxylase carboxyltransferase component